MLWRSSEWRSVKLNFKNQKVRCWGIPSQKYQNWKSRDGHSRIWTCARLPGIDFKSIVLGHSTMCPFFNLRRAHWFPQNKITKYRPVFKGFLSTTFSQFSLLSCILYSFRYNGFVGKRGKKMVFWATWLV